MTVFIVRVVQDTAEFLVALDGENSSSLRQDLISRQLVRLGLRVHPDM